MRLFLLFAKTECSKKRKNDFTAFYIILILILIFNHIVDEVGNMIKDYTQNTNLWSDYRQKMLTKD